MDKAIIIKNVTKKYKLYHSTKERLFDIITPKKYGEDFYALTNVNFTANRGEVVGFVGINGSGKSTLSNIIAGIVPQTSGKVLINGQVSLIAVNAGLNNELTGRDNIELKLLMLGFSKREIMELEEEIIQFAELEKFIDQPVKSYSSGMKSRLGFAISVNIDPDILVIDEALSVGDKAFAEKSLDKMKEFKERGKTMIFVSHSLSQMREFCDKILWLEFGKVKDYGNVYEILPKYENFVRIWKSLSNSEREEYRKLVHQNKNEQVDFLFSKKPSSNNYNVRFISKIGRLHSKEVTIYEDLDFKKEKAAKDLGLKEQTYFIKKEAVFDNKDRFYLISDKPSSKFGIVGWVKSKDVVAHDLTLIDEDPKVFEIVGEGYAYNRPWGSRDDIVFKDLASFKGNKFHVVRTEKVRNGLWYQGELNHKKVWIHQNRLIDLEEENSHKIT